MEIIHFPHMPTKIIGKQTVYRSLFRHSWWSRKECLTWRSYPSIHLSICLSITKYQRLNHPLDFPEIWFVSSLQKVINQMSFVKIWKVKGILGHKW